MIRRPPRSTRTDTRCPCTTLCRSGMAFKGCCKPLPSKLRPSWTERGIRERNMMLYRGVTEILGLDQDRDWLEVRRGITDDHIREVHVLYRALWPIETEIGSAHV